MKINLMKSAKNHFFCYCQKIQKCLKCQQLCGVRALAVLAEGGLNVEKLARIPAARNVIVPAAYAADLGLDNLFALVGFGEVSPERLEALRGSVLGLQAPVGSWPEAVEGRRRRRVPDVGRLYELQHVGRVYHFENVEGKEGEGGKVRLSRVDGKRFTRQLVLDSISSVTDHMVHSYGAAFGAAVLPPESGGDGGDGGGGGGAVDRTVYLMKK